MAESEEELKNLLMKVNEESEKVGLKLNILQGASHVAPGKSGVHVHGEGERVIALESW